MHINRWLECSYAVSVSAATRFVAVRSVQLRCDDTTLPCNCRASGVAMLPHGMSDSFARSSVCRELAIQQEHLQVYAIVIQCAIRKYIRTAPVREACTERRLRAARTLQRFAHHVADRRRALEQYLLLEERETLALLQEAHVFSALRIQSSFEVTSLVATSVDCITQQHRSRTPTAASKPVKHWNCPNRPGRKIHGKC